MTWWAHEDNVNAHKAKVSKKKRRDARTASNTMSSEPEASTTDPIMPCGDTRQLVVAVHFSTRGFGPSAADHIIRERVGVTPDPDFDQKLHSFTHAMFSQGVPYDGKVDVWLNEQLSYEEIVELTKFDDYVQGIYDKMVGALVLYIKSNDLRNHKDNKLPPEELSITIPPERAGVHLTSTGSGSPDT